MRPNLLAEIRAALTAAITPSLTTASAVNDIYEAYLFCLVLQAAQDAGALVALSCIQGGPPNPFVFRTSPGFIGSRTQNYGYATLEFQNCPVLEAHLGIRVSGHSTVLHEADVLVLFQDEADVCRQQRDRVAPRSHKVVLSVEAKYYTTDLALHLGRGFLGLTRDTSAHNSFFVINRQAPSIERLLAHKKEKWEHRAVPSEAKVISRLKGAFELAFRDYIAVYSN